MDYVGQHLEIVERIIDTCDELIDHLDKSTTLLRMSEDARLVTYNKL